MKALRPTAAALACATAISPLGPARVEAHPRSVEQVERACAEADRLVVPELTGDCSACHRRPRAGTPGYPLRGRVARVRQAFPDGAGEEPDPERREAFLALFCAQVSNQAPLIEPLDPARARAGDALRIEIHASDPEGAPLRFEAEGIPEAARLESDGEAGALLIWDLRAEDVGAHHLVVRVLDDADPPLSAETELSLEVVPNRPPELALPAWLQADPGAEISLRLAATDPDGDAVSVDALGLPEGARLASQSDGHALLVWQPEPGVLGRFEVEVEARDDREPPAASRARIAILIGDPTDAAGADRVRWDAAARVLHVRGAAAEPFAVVEVQDAESTQALATERAEQGGAFALSTRLARAPCAVRLRSGLWLGDPLEVEGAPGDCGARVFHGFRLQRAEWRPASRELRIEADRVPANASVDLFDAHTDTAVAHLRADGAGRLFLRTRTDTPPCLIRVIAEGIELRPLAVDRAGCAPNAISSAP
jgi:hypothetical protein